MSTERDDNDFAGLRSVANATERRLTDAVTRRCPGPHNPAQHRDGQVPWCNACGRTYRGVRIKDMEKKDGD